MKIIFDSEEQKEAFFKLMSEDYCPTCLCLSDTGCNNISVHKKYSCSTCWENCGLEVEVKNDKN